MKIKKGDTVIIVAGKDKGKTGKVEKALTKTNQVLVEGVNQYKRHVKARAQGQQSEIKTITKPLPISNVAFFDAKAKKPSRVGYKLIKNEKTRINKKSGGEI